MWGVCGTYGEEARCIQGFVTKCEGKRLLGRLWRRWKDNIKFDVALTVHRR
jgi:hypothetical protein